MNIVMIDMQIRDERILNFLRHNARNGKITIAADSLAEHFKCHPNTARAIMRRLIRAGYVEIDQRVYRGGFTYRLNE